MFEPIQVLAVLAIMGVALWLVGSAACIWFSILFAWIWEGWPYDR